MKLYEIKNNQIIIKNINDFNIEHILLCGQIFTFKQENNTYFVYSDKYFAKIEKIDDCYIISSNNNDYFINFFDLKTDYSYIKNQIKNIFYKNNFCYDIDDIISFGNGIRILKQSFLETVIGFAISANNNISRIMKSMHYIRENLGEKLVCNNIEYFAFPTLDKLKTANENFFVEAGCGYRARLIVKLVNQLENLSFENLNKLSTAELKNELVKLSGVGEKVADCIMLFCFARQDVFPVDTWIKKVYFDLYNKNDNPSLIRRQLLKDFGTFSGFVQQYMFYYKRSGKI